MEIKEKKAITFIWRIENFSFCQRERGKYLNSPEFIVNSFPPSRWRIFVFPNGSFHRKETLDYFLTNFSSENRQITADFQLSIMDNDGSIVNPEKFENVLFKPYGGTGSHHIPSLDEVYETKRSTYLPQDTLTLFCRLWIAGEDMEQDVQYFARTRIGVERLSKLWSIQNFSKRTVSDLTSTLLSVSDCSNSISLKMSLNTPFLSDWIEIEINPDKCTKQSSLLCKISLLNRFGKSVKEMQDKHKFLRDENHTWKFPNIISKRELIEKKKDLLFNDVLFLHCEFTISFGDIVYNKREESRVEFLFAPENFTESCPNDVLGCASDLKDQEKNDFLREDLLSLFQEKTLSDFELKSEGVPFPVHKAILCARSPVFKAMLTSNMREGDSKALDVPDVDADTLTKLLLYVYTGTFEKMDLESASKLYYTADKYQILSLKQRCSSELKSSLTVSKVSMILAIADRHQDDELISAVHDFIFANDVEIMQCAEWLEFEKSYSQLAAKTISQVYRKKLKMKPS